MSRHVLTFIAALAVAMVHLGCTESAPAPSSGAGGGGASGGDAGGTGGGAPPACEMWDERPSAPQAIIGPDGLQEMLISKVDAATTSVELMMYQLECGPCVDALVAAHSRGVAVRVLLDGEQSVNDAAVAALDGAGVPRRFGPAELEHNHAKVLLVDGAEAIVTSANMNGYSFNTERNYGAVLVDPQDVEQLLAIFERDWSGTGTIDTSCTRLIVSPRNARQRLLAFMNSATTSLDLAVMYASDAEIRHALELKIAEGVAVRVLLAMPEWIDSNAATAQALSAAGAQTRYLYTHELHAKLIIADGIPFVGSENLSKTSLDLNREIGILVPEAEPAAQIAAQFEADWAAGVSAP